jgi:hypothetical protein
LRGPRPGSVPRLVVNLWKQKDVLWPLTLIAATLGLFTYMVRK